MSSSFIPYDAIDNDDDDEFVEPEKLEPAKRPFIRGRRLGIDLGKARIGIAVSDPDGILATPVTTVRRDNKTPSGEISADIREIAQIVAEYDVVEIVLGLPVTLMGESGLAAEHTRQWSETLERHVDPLPITLTDERLTTALASKSLRAAGKNTRQQRSIIDQAAAVEILQMWLERNRKA